MMPIDVPFAAFSSTASVATSLSTGAVTSNSSTSLMAIVKVWSAIEPSIEVARTVILRLGPSVSRSIAARNRHDTGIEIDGKAAAGVVDQRIGDRVVGRIGIGSPQP